MAPFRYPNRRRELLLREGELEYELKKTQAKIIKIKKKKQEIEDRLSSKTFYESSDLRKSLVDIDELIDFDQEINNEGSGLTSFFLGFMLVMGLIILLGF